MVQMIRALMPPEEQFQLVQEGQSSSSDSSNLRHALARRCTQDLETRNAPVTICGSMERPTNVGSSNANSKWATGLHVETPKMAQIHTIPHNCIAFTIN